MTLGPETTLHPCEDLIKRMLATKKFNAKRLTAANVRRAIYADRAELLPPAVDHVARDPIDVIAARLKTKLPDVQELSWFYVRDELAGGKLLQYVADRLIAKAPPDIKFCGFSTEIPAMKVFVRHGLVAVNKFNFPNIVEWAERAGLRDRLPDSALTTKPAEFTDGVRWFFVQLHRL